MAALVLGTLPSSVARNLVGRDVLLGRYADAQRRRAATPSWLAPSPGLELRAAALNGDWTLAARSAGAALAAEPDALGLWLVQTARVRLQRGDRDDALRFADVVFDHAGARSPGPVWLELGRLCAALGETDRALRAFGEADRRTGAGPLGPGWYLGLIALRDSGRRDELLLRLRSVVEVAGGSESRGWREAMNLLAVELLRDGRAEERRHVYTRLGAAYPNSKDWPVFQAWVFLAADARLSNDIDVAATRSAVAYDLALEVSAPERPAYEERAAQEIHEWTLALRSTRDPVASLARLSAGCQHSGPGCALVLAEGALSVGRPDLAAPWIASACRLAGEAGARWLPGQPICRGAPPDR